MDSLRFDAFVKHLSIVRSRREGLRALLAGFAAGLMVTSVPDDAAAFCKGTGKLCKSRRQCCSNNCKKKRVKRKDGTAGKEKVGRCRCSGLGKGCHEDGDCCFGLVCEDETCVRSCDDLFQACDFDEDCCADGHICANNDKSIGCPGPVRFCCGDIGAPCVADCDCCGEVRCFPGGCGTL